MTHETTGLPSELDELRAENARLRADLHAHAQAEAALRAQLRELRPDAADATAGAWTYDPDRAIFTADAVAARLFLGRPESGQFSMKHWLSRLAADDQGRIGAAWDAWIAGEEERIELSIPNGASPGTSRRLKLVGVAVRDSARRACQIRGTVQVQRASGPRSLQEGQTRVLEMIATGLPLPETLSALIRIVQKSAPGMIASILVLDEDGHRLWTAAAPDLPEAYSRAINGVEIGANVGSCGTAAYLRQRVICADIATDPLWERFRDVALPHGLRACWSEPILSGGGDVLGTFALYYHEPRGPTATDLEVISTAAHLAGIAISARRSSDALLRVNRQLERAHARLEAILDGAPNVAIQCFDRSGRVVFWNSASERIYGFTRAEAVGRRLGDLILSPQEAAEFEELLSSAEAPRAEPTLREFPTRTRTGDVRWMLSSIFRVPDREAGSHWVCIDVDITERKQLEQQLSHSQKMEGIGRLAGGIAHDFNNLLTAIIGYAEMTQLSLPADHSLRQNLQQIQRAAQRAGELTRHLLAFARRQIIEPRVINVNELVVEMEMMLRRLIGEHITLTTQLAPDAWPVEVDPGQLEQIIVNLAVNARDAMPAGGRLTIQTGNAPQLERSADLPVELPPGDYLRITVADTGIGMTAETLAHVFEPFYTTKEAGVGTGLGLATAYGIVRQARGTIAVSSEPNAGATFQIYLPRAYERPREHHAPQPAANDVRGGETVLVVEDEPLVRQVAEQALRTRGYSVLVADSGPDALRLAQDPSNTIDLVLCDVVLPGMRAREFIDALQRLRPGVRVLYMSGYTDDELLLQSGFQTPTAILPKPFTPNTLARRVREMLGE
ncbi:MAG: PAS domain S-box protein [Phycisphaerae bacterium]